VLNESLGRDVLGGGEAEVGRILNGITVEGKDHALIEHFLGLFTLKKGITPITATPTPGTYKTKKSIRNYKF